MKVKIIPLIDFPLPFNEIKEPFTIKFDLETADKESIDFIQNEISKSQLFAKDILYSFSKYLESKGKLSKEVRYVIITNKKLIYRKKSILGLSELGGNSIVSLYLIQKEPDIDQEEEAIKVILHELGHGFGLGHCRVKGCIMSKLESIEDLRKQRLEFCNACKKKLENR
ncbi:MAG: matrixin family metalloprotease [Candidatus Micrarchaeia archaeon]